VAIQRSKELQIAGPAVGFHSILFDPDPGVDGAAQQPVFFGDLHLDQVVSSVIAGREQYELAAFFYRPLRNVEAVRYRHHVLRDLDCSQALLDAVRGFARDMRRMREHLALVEKLHYGRQRQRWFLAAAAVYCGTVRSLAEQLGAPGSSDCAITWRVTSSRTRSRRWRRTRGG